MKYKALICDIDGTLVTNSQSALPSKKVRRAVARASKKVHIGVATGRPLQMAEEIVAQLSLTGPCIFANGAVIYDPMQKKTVREHCLTTQEVMDIIPLLDELRIKVYVRDTNGRYELTGSSKPEKPIYVYIPPIPDEALEAIEAHVRTQPNLILQKMIAWEEGKVDYMITKSEATKQHAILEVAQILGITTHEIIGIGDGYNDFPLLMACGFKVAMGNATPDTKAIADYVAPTIDQDGVAHVIEKFILD